MGLAAEGGGEADDLGLRLLGIGAVGQQEAADEQRQVGDFLDPGGSVDQMLST